MNAPGDLVFLGDLPSPPFARRVTGGSLHAGGGTMPGARPGAPLPGGGACVLASHLIGWQIHVHNAGEGGGNATLDTDDNDDDIPDTELCVGSHGSHRLVARTGTVLPGGGPMAPLVRHGLTAVQAPACVPNSGAHHNDRGQVVFGATLRAGRGVLLGATPQSPTRDDSRQARPWRWLATAWGVSRRRKVASWGQPLSGGGGLGVPPGHPLLARHAARDCRMHQLMSIRPCKGDAAPVGASLPVLQVITIASSGPITTAIGVERVHGTLQPTGGGKTAFASEVTFTGETAFRKSGPLPVGRGAIGSSSAPSGRAPSVPVPRRASSRGPWPGKLTTARGSWRVPAA
jgi:hypothetical protein